MRSRFRGPVVRYWSGVGARFHPHSGGSLVDGPVVTRSCHLYHEVMQDVIGSPGSNNPCFHHKGTFRPIEMDGLKSYDWNVVYAYGLPQFSSSSGPAGSAVTAAEKDALLTQLIRMWTNTPPPIIQIGEYLTQFKQTVGIPAQVAKLVLADAAWRPWARNHLAKQGKVLDAFATIRNPALKRRIANETLADVKRAMKQAPKSVADGFLLWSFGIRPLLSDLSNCRKIVPNVLSRLRRLRDTNGVWTKHRTSRTWAREIPSRPTNFGAHEYKSAITKLSNTCSLSVEVKTLYKELDTCIGELEGTERFGVRGFLAVAQAVGLGNAPLVAWNAIPFSFVADWCFRVSDHLDKYGLAQAEGTYRTRNGLTTEKAEGTFEYLYGNQCPSYTHMGVTRSNYPYVVGSGEFEQFTRTLSLPQPSFAPEGYTPYTPGQQMLLAALFTQFAYKEA